METNPQKLVPSENEFLFNALNLIGTTNIRQLMLERYLSHKETGSQSLQKTMDGSTKSLEFNLTQIIKKSPLFIQHPEGFDLEGHIIRLGVSAYYILGVENGEFEENEDTGPFFDGGWDISEKDTSELAKRINKSLESLKELDSVSDMDMLLTAACYLKVKDTMDRIQPIVVTPDQ